MRLTLTPISVNGQTTTSPHDIAGVINRKLSRMRCKAVARVTHNGTVVLESFERTMVGANICEFLKDYAQLAFTAISTKLETIG